VNTAKKVMSRLHKWSLTGWTTCWPRRHDLRRERRHPLLVLYDAALNGDFDAAAELIDDACEYVMMPTMEVSRGKPAVLKAMGAAPEPLIEPPTDNHLRCRDLRMGVFEFVNEGTVATGIVDFAVNSDWQFSVEPALSSGTLTELPSAWCIR